MPPGNIRDFLSYFVVGTRIMDVSQSDPDDPDGQFVQFILENGVSLRAIYGIEGEVPDGMIEGWREWQKGLTKTDQ